MRQPRQFTWSNATVTLPDRVFEQARLVVRPDRVSVLSPRGEALWEAPLSEVQLQSARRAIMVVSSGEATIEITAVRRCGCKSRR
jgi:hypothetical protein